MKYCSDCHRNLPEESFHKDRRSKDGLRTICKACAKNRHAGFKTKNTQQDQLDGTRMCDWCREVFPVEMFSGYYKGRVCNHCKATRFARTHEQTIAMQSEGLSHCSKCGRWLPVGSFAKLRGSPTGVKSWCKECSSASSKAAKNRAKVHVQEKECSSCHRVLPASSFYTWEYSKDSLSASCKDCIRKRNREVQHENPLDRETKMCNSCHRLLTVNHFHRSRRSKDGHQSICASCRRRWVMSVRAQVKEIPENKVCTQCGKEKPAAAFYRASCKKNGLTSACKSCHRVYAVSPAGRFVKARVTNKRRKQGKNVENTITADEWDKLLEICDNRCPRCGTPFSESNLPTMDHIIPLSLGFGLTKENTQPLCRSCNSQKGYTEIKDYRPRDRWLAAFGGNQG